MKDRASALGLNVYEQTLRCEVKDTKGPLKAGEKEKIRSFVEEFLKSLK